jgi:hypothetical protein
VPAHDWAPALPLFPFPPAAAGLRESLGKAHPHNVREWLERKLEPARRSLGAAATAAAWAEGRAMRPEQAVAYALEASATAAAGAAD